MRTIWTTFLKQKLSNQKYLWIDYAKAVRIEYFGVETFLFFFCSELHYSDLFGMIEMKSEKQFNFLNK
jgi:hypothetical protein